MSNFPIVTLHLFPVVVSFYGDMNPIQLTLLLQQWRVHHSYVPGYLRLSVCSILHFECLFFLNHMAIMVVVVLLEVLFFLLMRNLKFLFDLSI